MTPVAIAGCFATYHPAPGPALLMLPQFGYEALSTYRPWRDLADRLAAAGTAVLRLDLPGTGDSGGTADMPVPVGTADMLVPVGTADMPDPVGTADMRDRIGAARDAIDAACAWLAERHGRVSLLGCRFGALLAADAAGRGTPCDALLLLDPPADGAGLARQLRARARLEPGGGEDRRAYGVPLTDAMLTGLAGLPTPPPAIPTLLIHDGPPPSWLPHPSQHAPFDGRDAFVMRDSFQREAPAAAFDAIAAFLAARSAPAAPPPAAPTPLALPGLVEHPVTFGPGLFGILCLPGSPGPVAALIPSTGNLPRSGPGRASVLLARQLAASGIASLRYDCATVGDSAGTLHGDPAVETYLPDQVAQVRDALDLLQARGFGRAVVVGHCSGAYQGWHAAADDARITGVFAINLQILKRMDPADAARTVRPHGTPRPAAAAPRPEAPPGLPARVKQAVQRACPQAVWDWLRAMTPEERAVRAHLRRLLRRGCRVHFVFGTEEDEQYRFHRAFGRPPRLPRGATLTVMEGADHMFSAARHRTRLLTLAAEFVALHEVTGDERGRRT